MDRGAWQAIVPWDHKESDMMEQLTHTKYHYPLLYTKTEKAMALHSSVLVWRIPRTGEPGWLPFTALHRAGHD